MPNWCCGRLVAEGQTRLWLDTGACRQAQKELAGTADIAGLALLSPWKGSQNPCSSCANVLLQVHVYVYVLLHVQLHCTQPQQSCSSSGAHHLVVLTHDNCIQGLQPNRLTTTCLAGCSPNDGPEVGVGTQSAPALRLAAAWAASGQAARRG